MTHLSLEGPLATPLGRTGWAVQAPRRDNHDARMAARRREYRTWFAVVLAVALPFEVLAWPVRALTDGALPALTPLGAARAHAAHVAPIILSA